MVFEINDANWEKKKRGCWVLEFYSNNCNPCKIMLERMREVSYEFATKVKFGKVNIDGNIILTQANSVKSVPSLVFLYENTCMEKMEGLKTEEQIRTFVNNHLKSD